MTATRAGTLEAMRHLAGPVHPPQPRLPDQAPPYTRAALQPHDRHDAGSPRRVTQTTYLIVVGNYTGRAGAEPFTLRSCYP